MNQLIQYLRTSDLPCAIFIDNCLKEKINYKYLDSSFDADNFALQNKVHRLVNFFVNYARNTYLLGIQNNNIYYLVGPIMIDEGNFKVGGVRDPATRFMIADTHIPKYNYQRLFEVTSLMISLLNRYYRFKKIKYRFRHPQVVKEMLKRKLFVKLSNNGAHVNYAFERETNLAVLNGDTVHIKNAMESLYNSGRIGILSNKGELRNIINFGIIAVSTNIRVALRHGMDFEVAYSLNDHYVYLLEKQNTFNDVISCIENELIDLSHQIEKYRIKGMPPAIIRAYHELLSNVTSEVKLNDLAAMINMSPNYFSSLFKKWIGISFTQFRALTRVNYSLTLLTATDKSISEIADELGFSDQAYFTNIFKYFTKVTPGQFRRDTLLLKDWNMYQFLKAPFVKLS
ncbi:helix-turn-helix domain-containing protein [Lactobacillus acetotolerans]|jgi:AraC-like DNA-binding protein|uniref:helix-turn-helix domain-containing protein n=1 Tax=Lactobacillus acetotolerans TaxID=1600 RepID=UPI00241EFAD7|nr:AraC family transcriptional regulator [Lactobacillus acetotolerans]